MNIHSRENTIRSRLNDEGYRLVKSRARVPSYNDQGGYMIVNLRENAVVAGDRFQLSLEDVENWMSDD